MDTGAVERLGGVDVADSDQEAPVHQKALDRPAAPPRQLGELGTGERRSERFRPEVAEVAILLELPGRRDEGEAEATRVAQPQTLPVVEAEAQVLVRLALGRRRRERQPAAHAEMDDQGRPAFDLEQEVLAPPGRGARSAVRRGSRASSPVERLAQGRRVDPDFEHPAAGQTGLETAFQDLDLGQLGHGRILPT